MEHLVTMERNGPIALLRLNRPEKLNALCYALNDCLCNRLDDIEGDNDLRAVVMTGAGDRAFSAGADIAEFRESLRQGAEIATRDFVRRGQAMTARIEAFSKPVIAAVNGVAFGGGCEITEAAHLAIAAESALFAKPEVRIGIAPTFGGTQRLPRLAGRKRALELLLTGEPFSPEQALAIGLINRIVPDHNLIDAAIELALAIIAHEPLTISSILRAVAGGLETTTVEGLLIEKDQFAVLARSENTAEKLDAWLERRSE
ncbi:crotonase/enoyl-CoA hydratase family protein [Hoeflea sp. WL0058]|uniref:Crotonase/enoyl-CoA hydratase family protein n=1 Tax=Flavimaribacter sediminis TaxID=2865987 RepID=A0AAE2ZQ29_9HYPH|nr:crotonase/enoyl-CoA hydratase family protein [Flavimaribacter sediminis]MBW8638398.1 crotonase/enoyl-CoA hydratase family protein [Flavimaribacter sediminis]